MRVVEAINQSLHDIMADDTGAHFIGEDILDPYGGAFKVSKGLSTRFPDRVLSTPISEAAIVGFGVGLALRNRAAIVELMFGDFLGLSMDQLLNHAAKFPWIFGGDMKLPLIVRTPMGGGRGYGPTHSQCIEKHFCGIPGLNVYAVHRYMDVGKLYADIHQTRLPALLIENKIMYAQPLQSPDLLVPQSSPDVVLLAYGAMIDVCATAAKTLWTEDELAAEVVPVHRLYPFDTVAIERAASRAKRIVAVEEAPGGWGFGAECAYHLSNHPIKFAHVAAADHPLPAARTLEERALPSPGRVIQAVRSLF
jgi:acetoin:2,6-dichlorophenolindophenol oxidoreductase subunit beta